MDAHKVSEPKLAKMSVVHIGFSPHQKHCIPRIAIMQLNQLISFEERERERERERETDREWDRNSRSF